MRATSVEVIEIRRDVRPRTGFEVGVSQGTEDQAVEEYLARTDPELLNRWNELQAAEARLKQGFLGLGARRCVFVGELVEVDHV